MHRLLLKNLLLSSLLLFIFISCSPTHGYKLAGKEVVTSSHVRPIIDSDSSLLYKAKITFYNQYFSGLILLKQTDTAISHLVFVTELGMKMFDFQIQDNELKLIYVFEPLNKPEVLNLLKNDLKLIFLQHLLNKEACFYKKKGGNTRIYKIYDGKLKNYYLVDPSEKKIKRTIVKKNLLIKEKVDYSYDNSLIINNIKLKHKGLIRLKIELNVLTKNIQ